MEKIRGDARMECKAPTKQIPSILIKNLNKELTKEEILDELVENENINKEGTTVVILKSNPKFRTNRAVIRCSKEDTMKIVQKGEVKIRFMIHQIKKLYNVIQCNCCCQFNHFEYEKDKKTKLCKNMAICLHCTSNEHMLKNCPVKDDMNKAKCVNCKGNHRSNDKKCKKRIEIENKIKAKYIC